MIKKILFILFNIFLCISGISQTGPYIPKVIPPSPDASSLGKYGEMPVGKYTGTASLSVPIYTISTGGIQIPISLSYNGSGIKVEEQASWVGLGWSLNAGGAIAISTVGLSDFRPGSGFLNHSYDLTTFPALSEQDKKSMISLISNSSLDIDPDIYMYNVNGNSGKFIIDKSTMKAVSIPMNDLQINLPDATSGNEWEILDAKGNKYIFNAKETSVADDRVGHVHTFNSTYYLTKIITNTKAEIFFNYQSYSCLYYIRNSSSKDYVDPLNQNPTGSGCLQPYSENYSLMEIQGKRIESIVWPGGKVVFKKNLTLREDILNDYNLQSVEIHNEQDSVLKKFNFEYDYFVGSETGYPSFLTSQMPNKRLRLLSVTESDSSNNSLSPYSFEYNDGVPYYFSRAQDLWGYYNGADANLTLLPKASATLGDANRKTNEVFAKAGSIRKVTYPTDGYTEFFYEANDALIPVSEFYKYDEPLYSQTLESTNIAVSLAAGQHLVDFTAPASINGNDQLKKFNYTITYPTEINCPGTNRDCTGNLEILLTSSDNLHTIDLVAAGTFVNGVSSGEIWLQAGKTYSLTKYGSGNANNTLCQVTGKNNPQTFTVNEIPSVNVKVGGLRIYSIVSTPTIGVNSVKKYFYHSNVQAAENEKLLQPSSGTLSSYPVFSYHVIETGTNYLCAKYSMSANSVAPMAVNGGSVSGYKFCQEVSVSPIEQQKTMTEYLSTQDFSDSYSYSYPFVNEQSRDYLRGWVLNEKKYKMSGTSFELVAQDSNTYNYVETTYLSVVGVKNGCVDYYVNSSLGTKECQNTIFKNYRLATKWFYKNSTLQKLFQDSALYLSSRTHFFYDNDLNLQLTRTETTNSKGDSIRTILKYPHDFVSAPSSSLNLYDSMVNNHRIGEVIEEIKTNVTVNKEIQRVRNNFRSFQGAQLIMPSSIQKSINNGILENEILFDNYDSKGNLIQYTKRDGTVVSILWGYNSQYPVAEIINSTYATVSSYISQTVLDNPTDDVTLRNHLNGLRSIPGAIVTTYTYRPIVGKSSETDPRGRNTYYEYDRLGRLQYIRDHDHNIIKSYEYQYRQVQN
ncbi:MAG: hypothetical protein PHD73_10560 [Sediminibacterium sp.]|nr:hypothetical protein [Sediminibacterium sp.]